MSKEQIYHSGLYNDYLVTLDNGRVSKISINAKGELRLGEVYLGVITYFDQRQNAFFVNTCKEEVYLKAPKMEHNLKVGANVIIEISAEKIKGKRARASLDLTCDEKLKERWVDLNPAHYSETKLLFSPYEKQSVLNKSGNSYGDFKVQKFNGNMYYYFDLIAEIERLLKPQTITEKGALFRIEELETLTAIDVDASSFKASGNFAYQLNSYLVPMIVEKIVQRDISGTVLIDFVNMKKSDNQQFLKEFKAFTRGFSVKGFTKTGLLELAITKKKRSLWQRVFERSDFGVEIKNDILIDYQLDKIIYQYLQTDAKVHKLFVADTYLSQTQRLLNSSDYLKQYPDLKIEIEKK